MCGCGVVVCSEGLWCVSMMLCNCVRLLHLLFSYQGIGQVNTQPKEFFSLECLEGE